jgi:hypothetical protein
MVVNSHRAVEWAHIDTFTKLSNDQNPKGPVGIVVKLRQGVNDKLRGTAVLGTEYTSDVSAGTRLDAAVAGLLADRTILAARDQSRNSKCGDGLALGDQRYFEISRNSGFRVDAWRFSAIAQTLLLEQKQEGEW